MIIEKLTLENFGVYPDRQEIILSPPGPAQPIILFGGNNGRGKTTFLEAIQLCLYGRFAQCAARSKDGYQEFLRGCIHIGSGDTAAVELSFRHAADGEMALYRIERRWTATPRGVNELFRVYRNGQEEPFLADHWIEVVEGILPRRIAELFLFDGEKIEAHATPEGAAQLIETATHSLLGMDIVDQLERDLRNLQQRKRKTVANEQVRRSVDEAEQEYRLLTEGVRDRRNQLASLRVEAATALKRLDQIQLEFMQKGGSIFERQEEIEKAWDRANARLKSIEAEIRDFAATESPLLLVLPLVERLKAQAERESNAKRAANLVDALQERDQTILNFLAAIAPTDAVGPLRAFLDQDLNSRRIDAQASRYLELSQRGEQQLGWLAASRLTDCRGKLEKLIKAHGDASVERVRRDAEKDSIPAADAIAELIQRREEARSHLFSIKKQIAEVEEEARRMEGHRLKVRQSLARLLERRVKDDFELEAAQRVIDHAERVQATLREFRSRAIRRHIANFEEKISAALIQLLQKERLVSHVSIDPENFQIAIVTPDGHEIPPERLSAGERQLLAISILWGLARASGRQLPTVIDTPLGRLDAAHRTNLVSHYFPQASEQVILLSTDEEISDKYLQMLEGRIGRSYSLVYEDRSRGTKVYPGYFGREEVAHAG